MQRTFGKRLATKPQNAQIRCRTTAQAAVASTAKSQNALWHAAACAALALVSVGAVLQWYTSGMLDKTVVAVGGIAALLAIHQLAKALGLQFGDHGNGSAGADGDWFGISDGDGGGGDGGGD